MPKTILLTFETDVKRDEFLEHAKELATLYSDQVVLEALESIKLDPPIKTDAERSAALFVSNKKMFEGSLSEVQRRFSQETAAHSASVEIRELRGGEWKVIRARKHQR